MDDDLTEVLCKSGPYFAQVELYHEFFVHMNAELRENVAQSILY